MISLEVLFIDLVMPDMLVPLMCNTMGDSVLSLRLELLHQMEELPNEGLKFPEWSIRQLPHFQEVDEKLMRVFMTESYLTIILPLNILVSGTQKQCVQ